LVPNNSNKIDSNSRLCYLEKWLSTLHRLSVCKEPNAHRKLLTNLCSYLCASVSEDNEMGTVTWKSTRQENSSNDCRSEDCVVAQARKGAHAYTQDTHINSLLSLSHSLSLSLSLPAISLEPYPTQTHLCSAPPGVPHCTFQLQICMSHNWATYVRTGFTKEG